MLTPFLIFFRRLECQCNDNMLVKGQECVQIARLIHQKHAKLLALSGRTPNHKKDLAFR